MYRLLSIVHCMHLALRLQPKLRSDLVLRPLSSPVLRTPSRAPPGLVDFSSSMYIHTVIHLSTMRLALASSLALASIRSCTPSSI
jgi:hypothetical protein